MRSRSSISILLALTVAACFKDEGGASGAGSATATSSTSLAPTTTGTSTPTPDVGAPDGSTSTTSGGESTSGTEDTLTSDEGTTNDPTTTGAPPSECGNGVLEPGEICDDGPKNADDGLCTAECQVAFCGDGLVQPILGEECDQGLLNYDGGACTLTCKKATCGDGHIFIDVEECDEGEDNQAGLYGGCTPMTCTLGPHCGDDDVQKPFEECDLGQKNGDPGEICSNTCSFNGNVVFVTSATYTGAIGLGGTKAADDKCNTLAMEAKLANAGAFRAWVSDGKSSPSKWAPQPAGPFILLDTTVIAESWADLTDGTIAAAINIYETGEPLEEVHKYAWTGTTPEGVSIDPEVDCEEWTNETKDAKGVWGRLTATNGYWSNHSAVECQSLARLICIEK